MLSRVIAKNIEDVYETQCSKGNLQGGNTPDAP